MIPLIQSIIFFGYLIFIWRKYGIRESISESWYVLPGKMSWIFTIWMWSVGLLMAAYENGWFFFSGAFLCFAGAAAQYKKKMTDTIHVVGATGSILLGFTGLIIQGYWPLFGLFLLSCGSLKAFKVDNYTWWVEVSAFVFVIIGLALIS